MAKEHKKTISFLKVLLSIAIILIVAAGIFCLTVFIVSTMNNVTFVEQLKIWFNIVPKETVSSAMQRFLK